MDVYKPFVKNRIGVDHSISTPSAGLACCRLEGVDAISIVLIVLDLTRRFQLAPRVSCK